MAANKSKMTEGTDLVLTRLCEALVCREGLGGRQVFEDLNELTEGQASNHISKRRVKHWKGLKREREDEAHTRSAKTLKRSISFIAPRNSYCVLPHLHLYSSAWVN